MTLLRFILNEIKIKAYVAWCCGMRNTIDDGVCVW